MPKGDHCAVFGCSNDRRYPEKYVIKAHVGVLRFYSPLNVKDAAKWEKLLNRRDFKVKLSTKVCSNHFKAGYRSKECPNPTLYLKGYVNSPEKKRSSPKGRLPLPPKAKKPRIAKEKGFSEQSPDRRESTREIKCGSGDGQRGNPKISQQTQTDVSVSVQKRKLFIEQATCPRNCFRYTGIEREKLDLVFNLIKDKANDLH